MALFERRKLIGEFQLDFINQEEVRISKQIPEGELGVVQPICFCFLYIAKLMYNFPSGADILVAREAKDNLHLVNDHYPLKYNENLLGTCCRSDLRIITGAGAGRWGYSAKFLEKNGQYIVDTKIAKGNEDHFHRAAIDVVLEITRRLMGPKGGSICCAAAGLFGVYSQIGCRDIHRNYQIAHGAIKIAIDEAMDEVAVEDPEQSRARFNELRQHLLESSQGWQPDMSDRSDIQVEKIARSLPSTLQVMEDVSNVQQLYIAEADKAEALYELLYLRILSIDMAIRDVYNDSDVSDALSEKHLNMWRQFSLKDDVDYLLEIERRVEAYYRDLDLGKEEKMERILGGRYAKYSGAADEVTLKVLTAMGAEKFSEAYNLTIKHLREVN